MFKKFLYFHFIFLILFSVLAGLVISVAVAFGAGLPPDVLIQRMCVSDLRRDGLAARLAGAGRGGLPASHRHACCQDGRA